MELIIGNEYGSMGIVSNGFLVVNRKELNYTKDKLFSISDFNNYLIFDLKQFFKNDKGLKLIINFSNQLDSLNKMLVSVDKLFNNEKTSKFLIDEKLLEERERIFEDFMLKEYVRIREEFDSNKDKNIIELINSCIINKNKE
jgi:hypothetical protein